MAFAAALPFDPATFLASAGLGRRIIVLKPKEAFFECLTTTRLSLASPMLREPGETPLWTPFADERYRK